MLTEMEPVYGCCEDDDDDEDEDDDPVRGVKGVDGLDCWRDCGRVGGRDGVRNMSGSGWI